MHMYMYLNHNTRQEIYFYIFRFTYISKAWGMGHKEFDKVLNTYIEEQVTPTSSHGFTGKLSEVQHSMTSREQFEMFTTVSNYHILGFPSHKDSNKVTIPNVSHHEHIVTLELKCYVPASPRNRIVYFIKSNVSLNKVLSYHLFLTYASKV